MSDTTTYDPFGGRRTAADTSVKILALLRDGEFWNQNKIQKSKTLPLVKRLFNDYVRSYKFYIAMAVICMVFAAATTAANAWIMQPVLDDVFLDKNNFLYYNLEGLTYPQIFLI